jgi:hypothetical protein
MGSSENEGIHEPVDAFYTTAPPRGAFLCMARFNEPIEPMTPGVAALGQEAVDRIVKTIAVFDDFCHANDPYEEHDFGSFDAEGHTIFFKIDYFDRNLKYLSPDPTDPAVTVRVITVMLADEY